MEAGTDPCDPARRPRRAAPRLALVGDAALHFATAANRGAPPPQFVSVSNSGGGTLAWQAGATQPWITITVSATQGSGGGSIAVSINPAGLAPGRYTGRVSLTNISRPAGELAMAALPETVEIPITLLAFPLKQHELNLPLIGR